MENVSAHLEAETVRAAALIAEYNPLHRGHAAQLAEIRSKVGQDIPLIVLLSSYFCQRGIPGLLPPRARAEQAIRAGADLVLKLPTIASTASAEDFGAGAIQILTALPGIDLLAFGLETPPALIELQEAAAVELAGDPQGAERDSCSAEVAKATPPEPVDWIAQARQLWPALRGRSEQAMSEAATTYQGHLRDFLERGLSYAEARVRALAAACARPALTEILRAPNHILALTYLRALLVRSAQTSPTLRSLPQVLLATHRIGQAEGSMLCPADGASAASATAIRRVLTQLKSHPDFTIQAISQLRQQLPIPSLAALLAAPKLHLLEDYGEAYLELLIRSSAADLEALRDWQNGLAQRAQQLVLKDWEQSPHLSELIVSALSERAFPRTRVQRALTSLLLNIQASSYQQHRRPAWTEVLAFNKRGKAYLRRSQKHFGVPVASRFSELYKHRDETLSYQLSIERRAASLYFGDTKKGHADLFTPALYLSPSRLES